jgi:signal peptidase I
MVDAASASSRRSSRPAPGRETLIQQISSFVGFFIYLLVLKSFFLPLFVIPTGSMAETLYGAHGMHTCPNCGIEYPVGLPLTVPVIQCPNCRWREYSGPAAFAGRVQALGGAFDGVLQHSLHQRGGDRIVVHGWPYEFGGRFAPQRWDVVVFKVPTDGQTNYIKRVVGKPGETVEIIDGDIFITDPRTGRTQIARKPPHVQRSLWFSCYNHDFPPRRPSAVARYHPRWVELSPGSGWSRLDTRRPCFDGSTGQPGQILFVTDLGSTQQPGQIGDVSGYNRPYTPRLSGGVPEQLIPVRPTIVTDVRLSAEITIEAALSADGYVELSTSKYGERFYARLYADGSLTLEHSPDADDAPRQVWGRAVVEPPRRPVHLALATVDYTVSVELDGRAVLSSTPQQYDIDAQTARERAGKASPPRLVIAARGVRASFAHLLIERDVYYTSDLGNGRAGYGVAGHPLTLGPDEYFLLGDNSAASLDGRFSFAQPGDDPVGPHLKAAQAAGRYHPGTVPADQLIGPAFFVYWPGMGELTADENLPQPLRLLNRLPSPGRIRWIH